MKAVLDWLRSGYPEGIPEKDHFAVLALLRRRLGDDDRRRGLAVGDVRVV